MCKTVFGVWTLCTNKAWCGFRFFGQFMTSRASRIKPRKLCSYPQILGMLLCVGSCSCRSRPLVTGFTLSLGVGGGGTRGGAGEVSGTEFHSFGGSNARHQAMRTKKNPAHPKACGVRCWRWGLLASRDCEFDTLGVLGCPCLQIGAGGLVACLEHRVVHALTGILDNLGHTSFALGI